MLREEVVIFTNESSKLKYTTPGATSFNKSTGEWTLTRSSGGSVYLQYETDILTIGDIVEVEFFSRSTDAASTPRTLLDLIGVSWQYHESNRPDSYGNLKRMAFPIKGKGKHLISVGLASDQVGTVVLKGLQIRIKTELEKDGIFNYQNKNLFSITKQAEFQSHMNTTISANYVLGTPAVNQWSFDTVEKAGWINVDNTKQGFVKTSPIHLNVGDSVEIYLRVLSVSGVLPRIVVDRTGAAGFFQKSVGSESSLGYTELSAILDITTESDYTFNFGIGTVDVGQFKIKGIFLKINSFDFISRDAV